VGGEDRRPRAARPFTIDPSRNPRRLDLVHSDDPLGTTRKYIYQVDRDTLRVAYTWRLGEPPAAFNERDDDASVYVATYQRAKK
jgi:uncharacterized protein (TIGR03067 family)